MTEEERTQLARERTQLARERTVLAHIRTGFASFLFGIALLGLFGGGISHYAGIAFIAIGGIFLLTSSASYLFSRRRTQKLLRWRPRRSDGQ